MADQTDENKNNGDSTSSDENGEEKKQHNVKILFRMGPDRAREVEAVRGANRADLIELSQQALRLQIVKIRKTSLNPNTDSSPPPLISTSVTIEVFSFNLYFSLYRKKALKWWAPNALSGIPKIVCGLRDDKRKLVRSIKYMHTDSIPVQYAKNEWAPDACMETMESLLSQIKEMVQDDDMSSVYHLALEPVEGDRRSYNQRPSRRFVSHGKRTDGDCTLIKEELINAIFK
nr:decapping and exoribonuclease protein-like [Lytechinus pictus]